MRWTQWLGLLGVGACAVGTDVSDADDTETADTVPTDTADPCAALTWSTVGAPFVTTWCAPCHAGDLPRAQRSGAPVEVVLDDEASVRERRSRVEARATVAPATMPPAGGPSPEAIARFAAWLTCLDDG